MELTQEKLKTGIKNQMQNFLEYTYLAGQLDPYGSGDIRMQDDAKTPCLSYRGAEYVMRPETENLFVADIDHQALLLEKKMTLIRQ